MSDLTLATTPRAVPAAYVRSGDQVALRGCGTHYSEPEQLNLAKGPVWWRVARAATSPGPRGTLVELALHHPDQSPSATPSVLLVVAANDDVVIRETVHVDPWDVGSIATGSAMLRYTG